jgi:hypothetical protein
MVCDRYEQRETEGVGREAAVGAERHPAFRDGSLLLAGLIQRLLEGGLAAASLTFIATFSIIDGRPRSAPSRSMMGLTSERMEFRTLGKMIDKQNWAVEFLLWKMPTKPQTSMPHTKRNVPCVDEEIKKPKPKRILKSSLRGLQAVEKSDRKCLLLSGNHQQKDHAWRKRNNTVISRCQETKAQWGTWRNRWHEREALCGLSSDVSLKCGPVSVGSIPQCEIEKIMIDDGKIIRKMKKNMSELWIFRSFEFSLSSIPTCIYLSLVCPSVSLSCISFSQYRNVRSRKYFHNKGKK